MTARAPLTRGEKRRLAIRDRDGRRCFYCGERMRFTRWICKRTGELRPTGRDATVEHLVAVALGGTDALENCVLAHAACNSFVGSRPLSEKLELRRNWRTRQPAGQTPPPQTPANRPTGQAA